MCVLHLQCDLFRNRLLFSGEKRSKTTGDKRDPALCTKVSSEAEQMEIYDEGGVDAILVEI